MQVVFEVDPLDAQRDVSDKLPSSWTLSRWQPLCFLFFTVASPSVPAPGEGEGVLEVRGISTW